MNTWKYIVYETTNVVNGKIYVGIHRTENPDKFDGYIGCGVYITQPYTYQYSKTAFQCAVKKYGPDKFIRKTLAVFDTEQEASDLEEQIVNENFLARPDVYNMILGGMAGCYLSQRIKVFQYDTNGNFIAEYVSFAEAALALNCDYTLISYAVRKKSKAKGYFWNTDKLDKLDLSNYNLGNNHSIKIHCYLKSGEFYKTFKTQAEAGRELKISTGSIRESRLLGNCVKNSYYFSEVLEDSYDKARKISICNRPVFRYLEDGTFDKAYDTQIEAELENKGSNITKALKLKSLDSNNYLWSLEKLENYNKKKKINEKRKVGKYNLDEVLVATYDSATKAANENGTSVWKVLSGTNKTHKGYIYKYID